MRPRTLPSLGGLLVAAAVASVLVAPAAEAAVSYRNCTELQQTYPHGVGRSGAGDRVTNGRPVTTWRRDTAAYDRAIKANAGLDRDKDRVACERR